jgi:hypothetical protein
MLAVVAAVEWFLFRGNLDFKDNVAVCWKYATLVTRPNAPGKDVLCFGDSMVKFGVLPRVIEARTGRRTYNLALHGGSPPAAYYALRHALEAGARPSVVITDFGWEILAEGPYSKSRTYPWTDLLTARECAELVAASRDADLLAWLGVCRLFPSAALRHEVRARVLAAFRGEPNGQRSVTSLLLRNWRANEGAIVLPKNPEFRDLAPPDSPPRTGTWRCHPVNALYLWRFFELAARAHVRVVWLLPPVSPGTLAKWEHSGNEALFERFVRREVDRYPYVFVIDGRRAGFERKVFVDGVHLDRDGATALSASLAGVLHGSSAAGLEREARWVALPPFTEWPADRLVEDYAQTRVAAGSERGVARR